MALDGVLLHFLAQEINRRLEGARVDKIQQPERDEVDLIFRGREGSPRLILTASPNNPRVHLSRVPRENPQQPPMFCMLLRKHLSGARFAGVEQPGLERILFVHFDSRNELGDEVRLTLAAEVMGRRSNVIVLDENGRIMDAVKRVDASMSSVRQILPGMKYEMPPAQHKTDLTAADPVQTARAVRQGHGEAAKVLLGLIQGVSPVVCREMIALACRDAGARAEEMTEEQGQRLAFFLGRLADAVRQGKGTPVLIRDTATGKPLDFSFLPVTQYGTAAAVKEYPDFSTLLDDFYSERDRVENVNRRAHDLLTLIGNAVERVSRRMDNQRAELRRSEDREALKIRGDLISANMYRLQKGMTRCRLENYYEEGSPAVEVELDPSLTPSQNAQKYYHRYRKASVAEKYLTGQIAAGQSELEYLDSVFDALTRAGGESEIAEIREELVAEGYLKRHGPKSARRSRESEPLHFRSEDGYRILVGRNNRQNDRLTLRTAAKSDIWLHTHNIPGAHVIVCARGETVPERTLTQAAVLAAFHSKARGSAQVPVDYTAVRNVKKTAGAKPGKVIYEDYRTAYVRPDPELPARCREDGPAGTERK